MEEKQFLVASYSQLYVKSWSYYIQLKAYQQFEVGQLSEILRVIHVFHSCYGYMSDLL